LKQSRREFLKTGPSAIAYGSLLLQSGQLYAKTLNVPLGLQLFSVREILPKGYAGTLKQLGSLGYREVESAGYYNHTAMEVKQTMSNAGLRLVSAHYSLESLNQQLEQILAFNKELGVTYIVCAYPGFKDPARVKKIAPRERANAFNLEDWRWNAEQFNIIGAKVSGVGMKFGYHNHTMEFHQTDGVVPYDELMRLTDPVKVTMEMDCGWVTVGGANPIDYLRKYPARISMLHVKDFTGITAASSITNVPTVVDLGHGSISYGPILAEAAKAGVVKHCFVEQEGYDVTAMQSLKIDADYMRKLGVG
jgi:sugar phosphate isomerase/epimerase